MGVQGQHKYEIKILVQLIFQFHKHIKFQQIASFGLKAMTNHYIDVTFKRLLRRSSSQ